MIVDKQFCFIDRIVMSPETFKAMPVCAGDQRAIFSLPANTYARALIERDGRTSWHVVNRQYRFGAPVYYAAPIVVRAYRAEAAE